MRVTPSIKALLPLVGNDAGRAHDVKAILTAPRWWLEQQPGAETWIDSHYNRPTTGALRMWLLDRAIGGFGVEAFETRIGWVDYINTGDTYEAFETRIGWVDYINTGDTYTPTIVRYPSGSYKVACWGDVAERHTA